ncbi:hypothetical protein HU200_011630 [Digitaria exilis]|uniref:Uncharacterized protein n=1 Tax=Digitaria exilis TaxID=1010633 RepID=A0A835KQI3_9POAL|nr:hypothetical protein HU200_011630 [Digitaria exilis]
MAPLGRLLQAGPTQVLQQVTTTTPLSPSSSERGHHGKQPSPGLVEARHGTGWPSPDGKCLLQYRSTPPLPYFKATQLLRFGVKARVRRCGMDAQGLRAAVVRPPRSSPVTTTAGIMVSGKPRRAQQQQPATSAGGDAGRLSPTLGLITDVYLVRGSAPSRRRLLHHRLRRRNPRRRRLIEQPVVQMSLRRAAQRRAVGKRAGTALIRRPSQWRPGPDGPSTLCTVGTATRQGPPAAGVQAQGEPPASGPSVHAQPTQKGAPASPAAAAAAVLRRPPDPADGGGDSTDEDDVLPAGSGGDHLDTSFSLPWRWQKEQQRFGMARSPSPTEEPTSPGTYGLETPYVQIDKFNGKAASGEGLKNKCIQFQVLQILAVSRRVGLVCGPAPLHTGQDEAYGNVSQVVWCRQRRAAKADTSTKALELQCYIVPLLELLMDTDTCCHHLNVVTVCPLPLKPAVLQRVDRRLAPRAAHKNDSDLPRPPLQLPPDLSTMSDHAFTINDDVRTLPRSNLPRHGAPRPPDSPPMTDSEYNTRQKCMDVDDTSGRPSVVNGEATALGPHTTRRTGEDGGCVVSASDLSSLPRVAHLTQVSPHQNPAAPLYLVGCQSDTRTPLHSTPASIFSFRRGGGARRGRHSGDGVPAWAMLLSVVVSFFDRDVRRGKRSTISPPGGRRSKAALSAVPPPPPTAIGAGAGGEVQRLRATSDAAVEERADGAPARSCTQLRQPAQAGRERWGKPRCTWRGAVMARSAKARAWAARDQPPAAQQHPDLRRPRVREGISQPGDISAASGSGDGRLRPPSAAAEDPAGPGVVTTEQPDLRTRVWSRSQQLHLRLRSPLQRRTDSGDGSLRPPSAAGDGGAGDPAGRGFCFCLPHRAFINLRARVSTSSSRSRRAPGEDAIAQPRDASVSGSGDGNGGQRATATATAAGADLISPGVVVGAGQAEEAAAQAQVGEGLHVSALRGSTSTPQWRGTGWPPLAVQRGRLLPEYRPKASPTFDRNVLRRRRRRNSAPMMMTPPPPATMTPPPIPWSMSSPESRAPAPPNNADPMEGSFLLDGPVAPMPLLMLPPPSPPPRADGANEDDSATNAMEELGPLDPFLLDGPAAPMLIGEDGEPTRFFIFFK